MKIFYQIGIVLLIAIFMISCISYNASEPKDNIIMIPEFGGEVEISGIQYNHRAFIVSSEQYYQPVNKNHMFAIFCFQIKHTEKSKVYDFSNILGYSEDKIYKPELIRYFSGKSVIGFGERGFSRLLTNVSFKRNGKYTIYLGFVIDTDVHFDSLLLLGEHKIDLLEPFKMNKSFIDKFELIEKYRRE